MYKTYQDMEIGDVFSIGPALAIFLGSTYDNQSWASFDLQVQDVFLSHKRTSHRLRYQVVGSADFSIILTQGDGTGHPVAGNLGDSSS